MSLSALMPNSDGDGSEISQQSSTLPRRHRRHISSESTFMIWSRDCSPIRRHSPHYSSGSLPRSIHSGHSKSKMRLQSRSPADESARIQHRHRLDEKISQEREKHFRTMQQQPLSGPSSLESGKTSVLSGPSSIDSGKNSSSRTTSCMSSLDSNGTPSIRSSTRRIAPSTSGNSSGGATSTGTAFEQYLPSIIASSMANNSITLQVTTSATSNNAAGNATNNSRITSSTAGTNTTTATATASTGGPMRNHNHHSPLDSVSVSSSSGRSSNCSNSTKIYVQNSPVRSVIKLENGKLADNANVLIINKNETIAGSNHKEVIQFNSLQQQPQQSHNKQRPLETQFDHLHGECFVVFGDSDSREASVGGSQDQVVINNKLNNCNLNDHHPEMYSNNNRKLSLQGPLSSNSTGTNLSYKNLLRQNSDCQRVTRQSDGCVDTHYYCTPIDCAGSLNNQVSGSVGCLGVESTTTAAPSMGAVVDPLKQLNTGKSYSQNKLNDTSNCSGAGGNYLSKLKSLNSIDSLATIYQKSNSLMTVGSEPNLMELKVGDKLNNHPNKNDKLNNMVPKKESNLTKSELDPAITGSEEMYDFPSLTDLSFNSLAALKILQELNSEKVKPTTMCP